MHPLRFHVHGRYVRLYKEPWEPFVYMKIERETYKFSLEENKVVLISGELEQEVLTAAEALIAQYFLPLQEIKRKRPGRSA